MSIYATETFSADARIVEINRKVTEKESLFPRNVIFTGKYSILNFFPKNIFEQFHRVANLWFLIVSILQVLPLNLSPTSSWATIAPLCLVLTVTMLKDGYQDYQRHKMDKLFNIKTCKVWDFTSEQFNLIMWKDIEVGNLIQIENEEQVPADIIILNSSYVDKTCFIETSNLDGETNLKLKNCVIEVGNNMDSVSPETGLKQAIHLENSSLKTEQPNNRLHTFEGLLKLKGHPRGVPLDIKNLILRGSTVKNTKWVVGVVVFTGPDTKLARNSKKPCHKRSNIELRLNKYFAMVFGLLLVIVTMSSSISIVVSYRDGDDVKYFAGENSDLSILVIFTFMILYNGFVPISLYVTIDLVRVVQAKFIQWDQKMCLDPPNIPANVKNADLNEELGQIEYLFTDKTGTLTENSMVFKKCVIIDQQYDSPIPDNDLISKKLHHQSQLFTDLSGPNKASIEEFLEILALCNTVIVDQSNEKMYQSASPDEEALVIAADYFGFTLINTRPNIYTLKISNANNNAQDLKISDECLEYKVLGINEFNSDRKRMSIVLEPISDKYRPTMLLCKGADNMVFPRCKAELDVVCKSQELVNQFACEGLRTLVVCKRDLTEHEAADYERKYNLARNSLYDRNKRLEDLADEFEKELDFVGIVGIEDKIQDQVPETICGLQDAGIKIWMLTGDKQETAINIGYSTKLLDSEMTIIKINCKSIEDTRKFLKTELSKHIDHKNNRQNSVLSKVKAISESLSQISFKNERSRSFIATKYQIVKENLEAFEGEIKIKDLSSINQCLVIDGLTLSYVLSDLQATKYFIIFTSLCKSVICCRTSPLQKSEIVKLIKNHLIFKPITLAIGDGANDVSMIREAHVGVGIIGKEGMQAANSSDYSIARFSYILRLLQIHGRWNYSRISRVVLYSFYKNFILMLPLFYYSFINLYSGTSFYDSWLMLGYNTVFTAFPVFALGCLDQDLPAGQLLKHTELYAVGTFSKLFNVKVFALWGLKAIIHSLIIFFLLPERGNFTFTIEGFTENLDTSGTASFFVIVQIATYEILLETEHWNWIFLIVTLTSVLIFYPFIYIYDKGKVPTDNLQGVTQMLFNSQYFLYILLTPCLCLLVSLGVKYFYSFWTNNNAVDSIKRKSNKMLTASKYVSTLWIKKKTEINRIARYSQCINKIFVAKGLNLCGNQDEDKDYYSISKYFLYFNNAFLEHFYGNYMFDKFFMFIRSTFYVILGVFVAWSVPDYVLTTDSTLLALRSVTFLIIISSLIISHTRYFKKLHQTCLILSISFCLAVKIVQESIFDIDGSLSTALVMFTISIIVKLPAYKILTLNILFLIGYFADLSIIIFEANSRKQGSLIIISYLILLAGILFVSSYVSYNIEKSSRVNFSQKKQLEFKLEKAQAILGYLLPDFVKDRVKQGVTYIEEKDCVTVVFCDIYNFEMICATHESDQLLELLDKFFAVLDQLCEKNGVTKIETVNKTYLICGGLLSDKEEMNLPVDVKTRNHAERCIEVALQILKQIEPVYLMTENKLQVKIGINSGKVIAGVVGEHKPQFALVGNTVNTAARMCQTLKEPDKIQISASTFALINHDKYCFQANVVAPKGLDVQETFILDLAKFRRSRKRDIRIDDDDSRFFDSTPCQIADEMFQLRPSHTILLPEIDKSHISSSIYNCDLDQVNLTEAEGVEFAGSLQWLQCSLKETRIQQKFRISLQKNSLSSTQSILLISISIYILELLLFILGFIYLENFGNSSIIALKITCIIIMIFLIISIKKNYRYSEFPWIVILVYITASFISSLGFIYVPQQFHYVQALKVMFTNLVVTHLWKLPLSFSLLACFVNYCTWICVTFKSEFVEFAAYVSGFISFFFVVNAGSKAVLEFYLRKSYNLSKYAMKEIKNTEKLLNQMMPPQVLRNLHNDITTTDKHRDVTIIYADISGFTAFCKTKEPIEVVGMLSKLFSIFDHLCVRHNVYKVHTIGDCYVILSFTDSDVRDPKNECINCIEIALDMLKAIKRVNRNKGISLNMRIGMHTGTVIAGITGTNIVRYDIYGPDNDIANKMESHGCPGKINLSKVTKELLEEQCKGRFEYEFNKIVRYEPTNTELEAFFLVPLLENDIMAHQD